MNIDSTFEGNALVYCQNAYNTTNGKTAHGLVRFTRRYLVVGVIDAVYVGKDAGQVLDGISNGIPIYADLSDALAKHPANKGNISHFVMGLAPDGGRLSSFDRQAVKEALMAGLHVDIGLHDFLTEDVEMTALAENNGCKIRDIRKPPSKENLHFFSGKIETVDAFKIAVLGTDSAVGKRTTAWLLVQALNAQGIKTEMIGTGQTAWLQGARHGLVLDALVNDFVAGEIEHAVWSAWEENKPQIIVIEGQGSLMNPAYPGGFEIIAAARPDVLILQHAPARKEYDGFPGYLLHPLPLQIQVLELLSGKPVVAVTVNHEKISDEEIPHVCAAIENETGRPAYDPLKDSGKTLAEFIRRLLRKTSLQHIH
ncbi:MAG: DUF1611 domain-containing protein [Desulfobacteraceae bacterium]|jgi:uncharacterized NAD-dependent epimerase/dehydratase family protein